MTQYTLLEIVQDILSDMDSDIVNSISDTDESEQVARIVRTAYENITTTIDIPTEELITTLIGLSNTSKPNYLQIPTDIGHIHWLKYDKKTTVDTDTQYSEVIYLSPKTFHDQISVRDESATNVDAITDFNGTKLLIVNDVAPTYWTSFDDKYIVFDSYDSSVDTTLQQSKTLVSTTKVKTFTLTDSFVPDLPDTYFPWLKAEAKALAFAKLKQISSSSDERMARRFLINATSKDNKRTNDQHEYYAQGRK